MTIYDLIARPAGWHPSAPIKLRQKFLGEYSSWYHYSTARHLSKSTPTFMSNSERLASSPCPDMSVELLSKELADAWKSMGLQLAKECDLENNMFLDTLLESLVLIQEKREIQATVAAMCRSLHPLISSDCDVDISFSDPALPFSVFVSCPAPHAKYSVERLAEGIIHEALHLQLSLFEKAEPLIIHNSDNTLIYSPWKGEGRTLRGLVHGIYVFGNLREFWTDVIRRRPKSLEFGKARISAIEAEMVGVAHIVNSSNLTTSGRRLAFSFL